MFSASPLTSSVHLVVHPGVIPAFLQEVVHGLRRLGPPEDLPHPGDGEDETAFGERGPDGAPNAGGIRRDLDLLLVPPGEVERRGIEVAGSAVIVPGVSGSAVAIISSL